MEEVKRAASSSLRMGEMSVADNGAALRTLLGSCIGLALYDRHRKIGGLAHIVLPKSRNAEDAPGKAVDTAVPALIEQMTARAGGQLKLTAKIAGGASMFPSNVAAKIGQQNIESCEQQLAELGIPILGRHCGGKQGRRMCLDTSNGKVVIEIAGEHSIEL